MKVKLVTLLLGVLAILCLVIAALLSGKNTRLYQVTALKRGLRQSWEECRPDFLQIETNSSLDPTALCRLLQKRDGGTGPATMPSFITQRNVFVSTNRITLGETGLIWIVIWDSQYFAVDGRGTVMELGKGGHAVISNGEYVTCAR